MGTAGPGGVVSVDAGAVFRLFRGEIVSIRRIKSSANFNNI
jgi:hypothetical protein